MYSINLVLMVKFLQVFSGEPYSCRANASSFQGSGGSSFPLDSSSEASIKGGISSSSVHSPSSLSAMGHLDAVVLHSGQCLTFPLGVCLYFLLAAAYPVVVQSLLNEG